MGRNGRPRTSGSWKKGQCGRTAHKRDYVGVFREFLDPPPLLRLFHSFCERKAEVGDVVWQSKVREAGRILFSE